MPRHLETFSTCAGPNDARPHTRIGGFTGIFISAYYANGALTIAGGVVYAIGLIFAAPPWMWCATAVAVIVAATEFKHWYYNGRLLCIRDRDCLIGTVISPPGPASTDGDMKLNIMPAPFPKVELEISLIDHIDRNRGILSDDANFNNDQTPDGDLFFPGGRPAIPSRNAMISNRNRLVDYMNALKASIGDFNSNMFNQLMIGVVDTMMDDASRNFYERFYRKLPAAITDAPTFNYIPVDFENINWQAPAAMSNLLSNNPVTLDNNTPLNPMFRVGSPSSEPIVPYMHCEIEGNYIEVLMNDIITAATGFTIGCVIGGPVVGAVVGFLAWLFKKLIDWITGNDGDATEPDVDWSDPSFGGYEGVTETTGDVVVLYGNWIMDTEHQQYFEIHPVRAYYILARNGEGEDGILVDDNEAQVVVGENFDPTTIDREMAAEICQIIEKAENANPDSEVVVRGPKALSFGMPDEEGPY